MEEVIDISSGSESENESLPDGAIKGRLEPWVEKYRPHTIDEIAHQEHVVQTLRNSLITGNLPHLLFYGPPGTGKTSVAIAIAHQLYGPALYKSRVLELNASDDRGIQVVREKIKTFAQHAVGTEKHGSYPCPPFKLIILDEADTMTNEAQAALRRTMETYSRVTRFCFICNYVSRIIEPLASRCAKFRFQSLNQESMTSRLTSICESESIILPSSSILDLIIAKSDGDMRRAVTLLQSCYQLSGPSHVINEDIINTVDARPVISHVVDMIKAKSMDGVRLAVSILVQDGFSSSSILHCLHAFILHDHDLTDVAKSEWLIALAAVNLRLVQAGGSDVLNLAYICAFGLQYYN